MSIFNRCENSSNILLSIPGWASTHPLLKVIPVDLDYSIPYGLLHSPKPSDTVKSLPNSAKRVVNE